MATTTTQNITMTYEPVEIINRCIGCGEDIGPSNPRQLCGKTFCYDVINTMDIGKEWQCRECKIPLTIANCPLCDETRDS